MSNATTTGVVIRNVRDDDLAIFFAHQLDPVANHMVAFTQRDPADRDAFLAHWAKIRADDAVTVRTIVFDARVVGYVCCFDRAGQQEVGYWIGRDYWGRGVATGALSQLLTEVKIRPLHAVVAEDNLASQRVAEKCGFKVIRTERSFARARGEEVEEVIMRIE